MQDKKSENHEPLTSAFQDWSQIPRYSLGVHLIRFLLVQLFAAGKDLPIDEWIRLGRCRSSVAKVCNVMHFCMELAADRAVPTFGPTNWDAS